jgi:predicted ABC-type ATPase
VAELDDLPCIWVLAGANGAGKSSIGGAMLRESGGEYFNPDEVAHRIVQYEPALDQTQANARAWALGVKKLDAAIRSRRDYFFETTLGGNTVPGRLRRALAAGHAVRIWYVGLNSVELNVSRVAERVASGGHSIPEADIRRRYDRSLRNLVGLLPELAELKVYDNSAEANPKRGLAPAPKLVLHRRGAAIVAPRNLRRTPDWAKAIVAQALKHTPTR